MKIRQHRGDVDFLWSSVENENDENNAYYLNCNNDNWNMNNKSNANSNYGFVVLRDFLLFDERKSDMAKKLLKELEELDMDNVSPMDAFHFVERWKEKVLKDKESEICK